MTNRERPTNIIDTTCQIAKLFEDVLTELDFEIVSVEIIDNIGCIEYAVTMLHRDVKMCENEYVQRSAIDKARVNIMRMFIMTTALVYKLPMIMGATRYDSMITELQAKVYAILKSSLQQAESPALSKKE